MIKKISLEGWRSFKRLKDFKPKQLNVLIGANQSGKSNFLDFISFLNQVPEQKDIFKTFKGIPGFLGATWAKEGEPIKFAIQCKTPAGAYSYRVIIRGKSDEYLEVCRIVEEELKPQFLKKADAFLLNKFKDSIRNIVTLKMAEESKPRNFEINYDGKFAISQWGGEKWISDFSTYLRRIKPYLAFNTSEGSPIRQSGLLESGTSLKPSIWLDSEGENLSNVLYNLQQEPKWRGAYEDITGALEVCFPNFEGLYFPVDAGQGRVMLGWKEKGFMEGFTAPELSDGTLKFLCLLAILFNPEPPPVICIEEPEMGLHPQMIRLIADLLKMASERTQLFVTTHSPLLVSALEPEHIVVVEKDEEGSSLLRRLEKKGLEKWLKDFTLGELWEMGEIGGR